MKYKIGDIVILKPNSSFFSWHQQNPQKKFFARICEKRKGSGLYSVFIYNIYSNSEYWGYDDEQIERKINNKERLKLFFEVI